MSDFYERIFWCGKMALQKLIRKTYLTQPQLPTFLSEAKAVLYSRPFKTIGHDLNDRITITPSHFLTLNTNTGTPTVEEDKRLDPDYESNNPSLKEVLLNT